MANYHLTVKTISRGDGKSCVSALAYRSATKLYDGHTGQFFDYSKKENVKHVEILFGKEAPFWIKEIAEECRLNRQSALQKLSDRFEESEKRKDARLYREIEFSLPRELTDEQNIDWAKKFINEVCVQKGMLSILHFHFDYDETTGEKKPHCHVLLSTREMTEKGFSPLKRRDWDQKNLLMEWREQCAQYQNEALKEHGFETRVDHRSYTERDIDIEPQPKKGKAVSQMTERGIQTDKQREFDFVKAKNKFKILKNPELVFSIVTSNHSTFVEQDIAKVLNRYIDHPGEFQRLYTRLLGSRKLVVLKDKKHGYQEDTVYTTTEMLKIEINLVKKAEDLSSQQTHFVSSQIIDHVVQKHNERLSLYGGLNADQEKAIRHMFSSHQLSCVIGYAGTGKTTSLEAAQEAWREAGYKVIGIAPTGIASENIAQSGIRSMTLHKFLKAQSEGREQLSPQTVLVLDEAGMVDSRRFESVLNLVSKTGAKIVILGDGNQLQSVEAGPAFRLISDRIQPCILETVVRQEKEWQREATRLFGILETRKALELYHEEGHIKFINEGKSLFEEPGSLPKVQRGFSYVSDDRIASFSLERKEFLEVETTNVANTKESINSNSSENKTSLLSQNSEEASLQEFKNLNALDLYCIARQMTGRLWHEMISDQKDALKEVGITKKDIREKHLKDHQDYNLYRSWKIEKDNRVLDLINHFSAYEKDLERRGLDIGSLRKSISDYKQADLADLDHVLSQDAPKNQTKEKLLHDIKSHLRKLSLDHRVDTCRETKRELVEAWDRDRQTSPDDAHLMLSFTNKDADSLNDMARSLLRSRGEIKGSDIVIKTQKMSSGDFEQKIIHSKERPFAEGDRLLFTKNDYGLGVRNGSLGTILEINPNKIKVRLDGKEGKEVSFSPSLYPYIDNGWATTIHKSQGVTVDHVKKLASYEEYRNLTYVGMSRHRKTIEVFGSTLDFWRPEKLLDRLSRVQEKLSGFDYLSYEEVQEELKKDHQILWYKEKIQQGKDFFKAVSTTTKDFFNHIFGKSKSNLEDDRKFSEKKETHSLPKTTLHQKSRDQSEEMRSQEIFKDKKMGSDPLEVQGKNLNQNKDLKDIKNNQDNLDTIQSLLNTETKTFKKEDDTKTWAPSNEKSDFNDLLETKGTKATQGIPHSESLKNRDKNLLIQQLKKEMLLADHKDINNLFKKDPSKFDLLCQKTIEFTWQRESLSEKHHSKEERQIFLKRLMHEDHRADGWKKTYWYKNILTLNETKNALKIENDAKRLASIEGALIEHNLKNNESLSASSLIKKSIEIYKSNLLQEENIQKDFESKGISPNLSAHLARSVIMIDEIHSIKLSEEKIHLLQKSLEAGLNIFEQHNQDIQNSLNSLSISQKEKTNILVDLQTRFCDKVTEIFLAEKFLDKQDSLSQKEVLHAFNSVKIDTEKYIHKYQNYQKEQMERNKDFQMER